MELPDDNPTEDTTFKQVIQDLEAKSTLSLDDFDVKRNKLLDQLAEIAAIFDEVMSNGSQVSIDLYEIVLESFRELVANLMLEQGMSSSTIELIAKLYKEDSDARVNVLNKSMGCEKECIEQFDEEVLVNKFTNILASKDTIEEASDDMAKFYQADFEGDFGIFKNHLIERYTINHANNHNSETNEITLEINKSPKEHVADVAKIAAGVLAALAVDRLIHRKK